jgi:TATA-box binding protein (TBP) (component of TFIID and TFIIIB)
MASAIKTAGLFAQCVQVTNVKYHVYVKRPDLERALEQEQGPNAGSFGEFQSNKTTRHLEGFAYFIYFRRRTKCQPLAVLNVSGVRDVSKELHYSLHLFLDRLKLSHHVLVGGLNVDNVCATARLKRQIPLRALQTHLQTAQLEHEQRVWMPPPLPPPPQKKNKTETTKPTTTATTTLTAAQRLASWLTDIEYSGRDFVCMRLKLQRQGMITVFHSGSLLFTGYKTVETIINHADKVAQAVEEVIELKVPTTIVAAVQHQDVSSSQPSTSDLTTVATTGDTPTSTTTTKQ